MNRTILLTLAWIGGIAIFCGLMFSSCATGFGAGRTTSNYTIAVAPTAAPAARPSAASLPSTVDPAVVVLLERLTDGQVAQGKAIAAQGQAITNLGKEVAQLRQQSVEQPVPAAEPRWSETRRRPARSSDCDGCDAGWSRPQRRGDRRRR